MTSQVTKPSNNALCVYDWIESTKTSHLTISDFQQLRVGEFYEVLMLDRNFEEYHIWKHLKPKQVFAPEVFFKGNRALVRKTTEGRWDITFPHGEIVNHPIHVSTKSLACEFDWMPVSNMHNAAKCTNMTVTTSMKKNNIDYAKKLRVGWRGPMIYWHLLKQMPSVYYAAYSRKKSRMKLLKCI